MYIGAIEQCGMPVYICGFIPSYLLPNKQPNFLDPFLSPLIEEIEELFIDGNYFYV